jgi:hypothetical protein
MARFAPPALSRQHNAKHKIVCRQASTQEYFTATGFLINWQQNAPFDRRQGEQVHIEIDKHLSFLRTIALTASITCAIKAVERRPPASGPTALPRVSDAL